MSIPDETRKGNSNEDSFPTEEEFDIVPVNTVQNGGLRSHLFNIISILLIASASFGLGRFSFYKEKEVPMTIRQGTFEMPPFKTSVIPEEVTGEVRGAAIATSENETVVASKAGSKYHLPWCAGAKQIAEKNKITFSSPSEARKAGYTPAVNCKGLK